MKRGRGFTLIELIVVIAIIAVLASVLLPSLVRSRESGYRAACSGHLRGLYTALINFSADHSARIPMGRPTGWPGYFWNWRNGGPFLALEQQGVIRPSPALYCPRQRDARFRYGSVNGLGSNPNRPFRAGYTLRPSRNNGWDEETRTLEQNMALMPTLEQLRGLAIAADVFGVGDWTSSESGGPNGSATTHPGGLNVLYANGSVAWVKAETFSQYTASSGWGNDYRNILNEFVSPNTGIWVEFDKHAH